MQLYNSLTKKVEEFKPLKDNEVRMYSCGPTVYDHAHIGNLSAYIFADTLHRTLELAGYKIKHVMNYTDVDDKTIARSQPSSPLVHPMTALKELTDRYIEIFNADMRAIGNDISSLNFIRATEHIEEMQKLITELIAKKFAYLSDDGIYFSIEAYRRSGKTYGQLSNIGSAFLSKARIQNDEYDKDQAQDFALWKIKKDYEPFWDFVIDGRDMSGRPGWHIECSAMSRSALGQPFDVHTGGIDLIFPHHENEIAQSTALTDDSMMAKYFAHNNHILVEGKKMSKSAKNFFTLQNILDKRLSPLAFRLMILQGHYRSQVNFTWDSLHAAQSSLQHIRNNFSWIYQSGVLANSPYQPLRSILTGFKAEIKKALLDDLNTPSAIAALHRQSQSFATVPASQLDVSLVEDYSKFIENTLGFSILDEYKLENNLQGMIDQRLEARRKGDWAMADKIRDELLRDYNIGLKDTDESTIWYRVHKRD